jgi:periplasmic divalent cation tolerance protein
MARPKAKKTAAKRTTVPRDVVVCLSTASSADEAAKIARDVVEQRLAACVNIVPAIRSIYSWQGKIEDGAEVLMIIKTRKPLVDRLSARIRSLHSYTVPEVISMAVTGGNPAYLLWVADVVE